MPFGFFHRGKTTLGVAFEHFNAVTTRPEARAGDQQHRLGDGMRTEAAGVFRQSGKATGGLICE